jgi:hypothetical protein
MIKLVVPVPPVPDSVQRAAKALAAWLVRSFTGQAAYLLVLVWIPGVDMSTLANHSLRS